MIFTILYLLRRNRKARPTGACILCDSFIPIGSGFKVWQTEFGEGPVCEPCVTFEEKEAHP